MTAVAVLGLGAMGLPMATRLAERFTVRGFDPNAERSALGADAGVTAAGSAREAATGADAVLLAVRNHEQLEDALYGDDGVVGVLTPGALVILTSTVGIDAVREVAARLSSEGFHLVDAPISGGPARAGQGDLLVTVGATDEAYAVAQPILDQLAGEYEGRVKIVKIDADQNPETVTAAGVTSIPTLGFYRNGERVDVLIGAHPKPVYAAKIEELLA